MPHVNLQGVDACVSLFIVHDYRCLLVNHEKLGVWLGIGGHWGDTDKDETFDDALYREALEEVGLTKGNLYILGQDDFKIPGFDRLSNHNHRNLLRPVAIDLHDFPPVPGHRHQALVYVAVSDTDVIPEAAEYAQRHHWFTREELKDPGLKTLDTIRWYGDKAITMAALHQARVEVEEEMAAGKRPPVRRDL